MFINKQQFEVEQGGTGSGAGVSMVDDKGGIVLGEKAVVTFAGGGAVTSEEKGIVVYQAGLWCLD